MLRYKEETQSFWQSHVDAFKQLDITKVGYANANNLDKDRWSYWSSKLMRLESGFLPVKLTRSSVKNEIALLTIEYPQGIRLSIHHPSVLSQLPSTMGFN